MPTYAYRCFDCGHEFEEVQRMSDPAIRVCPTCGKEAVKRLISATAFHLKGSGWYKTDYPSAGAAASNGGGSATDSSGSSESKTDALPAAAKAEPGKSSEAAAPASAPSTPAAGSGSSGGGSSGSGSSGSSE